MMSFSKGRIIRTFFLVTAVSLLLSIYPPKQIQAISFTEIQNAQKGKVSHGQVLGAVTPSLPLTYLDTTYSSQTSGTCTVTIANGGSVQAAIDAAGQSSSYVICLQAGGTFASFILRNKSGSGWITIRTSTPDAQFINPGQRISPSQSALLAKIVGINNATVISTDSSAHNYRLIGLDITTPNFGTKQFIMRLNKE